METTYEYKARRRQYWQAIYEMREEYMSHYKGVYDCRPAIHAWAEEKYGIKMGMDGQGNYTQHYDVVSPKKFMLFQIRYMK